MSKLSIVIPVKNDNYGGNLIHRAIISINNALDTADEVILVDWKSNGQPLFDELIPYLPHIGKIKSIVITPEFIKENLPHLYDYAIVETIARNVGIRRASNDVILSTNIDTIYSLSLHNFSLLEKDTLYTAARRDIPENIHLPFWNNYYTFKMYCMTNIHNFPAKPDCVVNSQAVWDAGDIYSLVVCCGDFQLAHKDLWYKIRGFEESATGRCYADSNLMKKGYLNGKIDKLDIPLFHLNHGNGADRLPNEILPINNQQELVVNFNQTTNKEDWGLQNFDLPIETY